MTYNNICVQNPKKQCFVMSIVATLALVFVLSATQSANASVCTDYRSFAAFLAKKYGEAPRSGGIIGDQAMMQVFVSKKGSWSILVISAKGNSCLIAAGRDYMEITKRKVGRTS